MAKYQEIMLDTLTTYSVVLIVKTSFVLNYCNPVYYNVVIILSDFRRYMTDKIILNINLEK